MAKTIPKLRNDAHTTPPSSKSSGAEAHDLQLPIGHRTTVIVTRASVVGLQARGDQRAHMQQRSSIVGEDLHTAILESQTDDCRAGDPHNGGIECVADLILGVRLIEDVITFDRCLAALFAWALAPLGCDFGEETKTRRAIG